MGLFGFGKKKEEKQPVPTCCCGNAGEEKETAACGCADGHAGETTACCCAASSEAQCDCGNAAAIKVLGAGCKSCHEQFGNVKAAVQAMGLSVRVEYVTDMEKVMAYGAMSMPAIVVNEQVVSMGKVLKAADVEKLLRRLGL